MSSDKENRDKDISSMLSAIEEALKHDSRRTMFEFVDGVLVPRELKAENECLVPDPQYRTEEIKPEDREVYRFVRGVVVQTYVGEKFVSQWFEPGEERGWRDRDGNPINRPPDLITYPAIMHNPCD